MVEDIHSRIERAQQSGNRPDLTMVLERMQPDIAASLPKGIDPDRVTRLALTLIRQSEMAKRKGTAKTSLAECSPESFAGALLTAVALGLEPGLDGEAWLVPYGRECTFIPGYRGITKLFWQHPLARYLDAQAVYEGDEFDYELGLHPALRHKPALGDRGEKITHYYAAAALSTGAEKFEVMSAAEVAAVRDASPRRSGDIRDPQHWMERKTVLKQLLKIMPKSYRLQYALDADEQPGGELVRQDVPRQIAAGVPIETAPERIDMVTGEITVQGDNPANHIPPNVNRSEQDYDADEYRDQDAQRAEERAAEVTSNQVPKQEAPQTSPSGVGEATTDQAGSASPAPAGPSVEDQQAGPGRPLGERPGPAADPESGPAGRSSSKVDVGNGEADEPNTPAGRLPGSKITVPQQAEINSRFMRLDVTDTQEKVWWANKFAGLAEGTVSSIKELRQPEADKIIAALDQFTDRDQLDASINQDSLISP